VRVAIALDGTDRGRSGLGVYVRSVLPPLASAIAEDGGSITVLESEADEAAYGPILDGATRVRGPVWTASPAASALWHLLRAGTAARDARADVLLLPAANRRLTAA
jgi:hypothetical protein